MDHVLFGSPEGLNSIDKKYGFGHSNSTSDSTVDQVALSSSKNQRRIRKQMNKSVSFADDVKDISQRWNDIDLFDAWASNHDIHKLSSCKMPLSGETSPNSVYYQFDANENDNIRGDRLSTSEIFTPKSNKERKEIPQQSPTGTSEFEFSLSSSKSSSTCISLELNVDSYGFMLTQNDPDTNTDHSPSPYSSKTSFNTTEEIAECVADILEQTIASSTQNRDDSSAVDTDSKTSISMTTTNEIEECVADIMNQTMATDRLMTRLCYIKKRSLPNRVSCNLSQIDEEVKDTPLAPKTIAFKKKSERVPLDAAKLKIDPSPLSSEILSKEQEERARRMKLTTDHTGKQQIMFRCASEEYLSSDSDSGSKQSSPSLMESSTSTLCHQDQQDNLTQPSLKTCTGSACSVVSSDFYDELQKLNANATEFLAQDNFDGALQAFERVLELFTKSIGELHPIISSTYHNIGIVYCKRASISSDPGLIDDYKKISIDSFQKAADIARMTLGIEHPNVAVSLVRLGLIQLQMGNFEDASFAFYESLNIRKKSLGDDHPLVAKVYNNIGVANLHADRMQSALDAFECASSLQRRILSKAYISKQNISESEMELADTLCNIGSLCLDWIEKDGTVSVNVELIETAISAFTEVLSFRCKHCVESDERVQQARSLLDEATSFICRKSNEIESNDSSSTSAYATACENVAMCPSDENLFAPESHTEFKMINNGSSFRDSSPVYVKDHMAVGFEIAPVDILTFSDNRNQMSRGSFISELDDYKNSHQKNQVSIASQNSPNPTTPSQIRMLSQTAQSLSDSPPAIISSQKTTQSSKVLSSESSSVKSSFDESHTTRNILRTSDFELNPISSKSIVNEVTDTNDVVEFAKDPHKYSFQIHDFASKCLKSGDYDKSLSWFTFLLAHYRSEYGELHRDIGATLHNIGLVLMRLERYNEALLSFQRAVRVRRGAIGRDHADVATSLVKVGVVETILGRFDSALFTFREALSVRRHALGHLHPSTAGIYNNIGCAHLQFNEMREARCAFESALDVQRNALLDDPKNIQLQYAISSTLLNLAHLYTSREMYEKACLVLSEALSFQETIFGSDSSSVMSTLDLLADSYAASGDITKALSSYGDILEKLKGKGGSSPSNCMDREIGLIFYKISQLHKRQNDLEATMKYLERSVTYFQKSGSSEYLTKIENEIEDARRRLEEVNFEWV